MRFFFLKGLLILGIVTAGAVCAYAAIDTEKASPAQTVTQQTVDSLPVASNQTPASAAKAETWKYTIDAQPVQVAMVSGDYHKYEAMTWQNRGYSGGIKDLNINYTSGDDITIDMSGGAIAGNGDYRGAYSIKKKDVGYVDVDFKQFRKYYDTYGGIWQGTSRSLSRDLSLDIGHFGIEAGITMPDLPNVSVYYDHDYKDGAKSMPDWASMIGASTKLISPSWKEIQESVDTFGIKGDYTEKGYHFTGDQRWEIAHDKTESRQPQINLTGGAATQVRQRFKTDTTLMTTTLGADKWYLNDKVFAASAYRFQHLKNTQNDSLVTLSNIGGITANTEPNTNAHNKQNVNSWVVNFMASPSKWLSGTGSIKAEVNTRDGESYKPANANTSVPLYRASSDTYKLAEAVGLRFKAIPRTVIYSDLSFEQSANHLRVRITRAARQSRDALIDEPAITWTTGADFQPLRFINLTSQFRLRDKRMDFQDETARENIRTGQVFLKEMHTQTLGFTQRATARLSGWAQTSFRYLYDATDYSAQEAQDNANQKARMLSNTFIYDLSVYPASNLSMTGSFSQLYSETKTVASAAQYYFQPFDSNSSTWMLASDYQPHKKINLNSSLFYTLANNYGDHRNTGLVNYASAFDQLGLTVGCKWDVTKDLSVKPQYGYQRYLPNERSGIGGAYNAQIVSLAITTTWG